MVGQKSPMTDIYLCDSLVIAAGPWSNQLIKTFGYDFALFPMRGYHQHFETTHQKYYLI